MLHTLPFMPANLDRRPALQSLSVFMYNLAVLLLVASTSSTGWADDDTPGDRLVTWEISHPELREIFGHPFSPDGQAHRATTFVRWPSTLHESELPAIQPTVVIGNGDELFAESYSPKGWNLGLVAHSTNGGQTWSHIGSPVDMRFKVPDGHTQLRVAGNGVGVTENGTLLYYYSVQYNDGRKPAAGEDDPSHRIEAYVARSTDRGATWEPAVKLNTSEREQTGAQSCRLTQLPGGKMGLVLGTWDITTASGEPIPTADQLTRTFLYTSSDDGQTWERGKEPICEHGVEPDLIALPSGRLLLAIRYQRHKSPNDPPNLASPHLLRDDKPPYTKSKQLHSGLVARFTAILHSDDGGKTWTEPGLLTGFDEQTGSLVRLSDGTIILPFGYKTDTRGQRFVVSYDEGETWSRTVFQLHPDGQYASSVVLADDTIVSVIHGTEGLNLQALRWRAPPREEVIAGGFWTPRVAEPLGHHVLRHEPLDGWQSGQQHTFDDGLRVSLSQPVLVTRSKGYRWFPSLTRLADGNLLATMSNHPDDHVRIATAEAAWSGDGGLTWSNTVTTRYGNVSLNLPNGDVLLLPYYLKPISTDVMGAPYQIFPFGQQKLNLVRSGMQVSGLPAPDRSFSPEHGLSGFVFNGQSVLLKDGNYLAMLYGYFQGSKRYSLLAAESANGVSWKIRSMIAGEDCPLPGNNGPCESAVCRLRDGRLMCVFRLASNVAYGQTFSSDEGKTWTEAIAIKNARSVQPGLAVMSDGLVALSGGRPGLFLWLNSDGTGRAWHQVDIVANHNEFRPEEPVVVPRKTSAYTQVVALDEKHLLYIYDRVPNGWMQIPGNSSETNSVWVVRATVQKKNGE